MMTNMAALLEDIHALALRMEHTDLMLRMQNMLHTNEDGTTSLRINVPQRYIGRLSPADRQGFEPFELTERS